MNNNLDQEKDYLTLKSTTTRNHLLLSDQGDENNNLNDNLFSQ